MNRWTKSLSLACVVEMPLVSLLYKYHLRGSIVATVLNWYHMLSILFAYAVTTLWNHWFGAGSGIVQWLTIFTFQVALTTPIIFVMLKADGPRERR